VTKPSVDRPPRRSRVGRTTGTGRRLDARMSWLAPSGAAGGSGNRHHPRSDWRPSTQRDLGGRPARSGKRTGGSRTVWQALGGSRQGSLEARL
jgi:hypothetical protein